MSQDEDTAAGCAQLCIQVALQLPLGTNGCSHLLEEGKVFTVAFRRDFENLAYVSDAGRGRAGEKQGTDAMKLLGGRKSYKSIRTS